MDCRQAQIQISALLDGALEASQVRAVREHLDSCGSCKAFYEEQAALSGWIEQAALDLEPPAGIWERVETQIQGGGRKRVAGWFVPRPTGPGLHLRMVYAAAVVVLVVLASVVLLLQNGELSREEKMLLAELEAISLEVPENPFLPAPSSANPFLGSDSAAGQELERPESRK